MLYNVVMSKILFFQFGKYFVVGTTSTILSWAVFNLLMFFTDIAQGLIINLYAIIAFVVSRIYSFFWTKFWVFKHKKRENIKQEWVRFFAVSTALTIINLLIIHTGVNIIGPQFGISPVIWSNIFFLLTIPTSMFGNFFGYKFLVFR